MIKDYKCLDCLTEFDGGNVFIVEDGLFKSYFCPKCRSTNYTHIPKTLIYTEDLKNLLKNLIYAMDDGFQNYEDKNWELVKKIQNLLKKK